MTRVRFAPSPSTHRRRVRDALEQARRGVPPAGRDIAGRWLSGVAAFADRDGGRVLALLRDDGFFRWQPAQGERHAASLEAIVGDPARDIPTVFAALTRWPRMEYASMDRLCARRRRAWA